MWNAKGENYSAESLFLILILILEHQKMINVLIAKSGFKKMIRPI